jgi:hypothetical protein
MALANLVSLADHDRALTQCPSGLDKNSSHAMPSPQLG